MAVVMSSCSKNEVMETPTSALSPVGFSTYYSNAVTKATDPSYAFATGDVFVVDAYYVAGGADAAVYANQTANAVNFMDNQKVIAGAGDNEAALSWSYTPLKYWPNNDNDRVSFFAYTFSDANAALGTNDSFTVGTTDGTTTSSYNIYPTLTIADASTLGDLMVASVIDQAKTASAVALSFKHVTAGVAFKAKLGTDVTISETEVIIKSIDVDYAVNKYIAGGKFVYNIVAADAATSVGTWVKNAASASAKNFAVLSSGTTPLVYSSEATGYVAIGDQLNIIPQSEAATVTVTYTVKTTDSKDGDNSTTNTSTITNKTTFDITPSVMNTLYTYQLNVSLTGVTVSGTTSAWDETSSSKVVEIDSSTETVS